MLAILLTSDLDEASDVVDVLLLGVSLAVAAVPEGLQTVLTVVLALGVQRMARRRAIVTKLSSVETLGSASVICTDKTGTLTKNEMTITRVVTHSGEVTLTGTGYRPEGDVEADGRRLSDGPLHDEVAAVLGGGSLANNAVLQEHEGAWSVRGDPTDAAFLVAERKLGIRDERIARFTRVDEVPFTSDRKLMSTIESDTSGDAPFAVVAKGAPDVLLARCTRERVGDGTEELTDARRVAILAVVDRLAEDALRTLAVAYRPVEGAEAPDADEALEHRLIFAGVVGMIDPRGPKPSPRSPRRTARGCGSS